MSIPEPGLTDKPGPFAVRRRRAWRTHVPVIAAVAAGGGIGATARYAATVVWPTSPSSFPWTTLVVNVTGCALMGTLLVLITEVRTGHRMLRPFLGTGILGGYTTFSAYAADTHHLLDTGHAATAWIYLGVTPITALIATWTTAALTRHLLLRRTA
ncbi:CrcB family protein [Nocardia sp. CNY236]|uniref:fluoride efflux transporter FluC n=1 Tax=Nocardia sp. CNY236 TaxID=1169152 RepID=UPI00040BF92B|nr:CrcB family protein [Nocardia sp. CNY236]